MMGGTSGTRSDEEDEQDMQNRLLRGLFGVGDETTGADDEEDEDGLVSKHNWTLPDEDVSIVYHLAFLAPGHGDALWNSAESIAEHILVRDLRNDLFGDVDWPPRRCIEFGAGAALPSLAMIREGAHQITITDMYVNEQAFDAIRMSVEANANAWGLSSELINSRVSIQSHSWGKDIDKLCDGRKADLLIASDCIYNPTHHRALLQSAIGTMSDRCRWVVGYSFHGNVSPNEVLAFFDLAREFGLEVTNALDVEFEGQRGIGSNDASRGAVHLKVLEKR